MTGISAGAALSNAGVTDFKIIEYQGRIGGRTIATEFGKHADGSPWNVELGTNWVSVPCSYLQHRLHRILTRA